MQWVKDTLPGVERLEYEAYSSPPFRPEVENKFKFPLGPLMFPLGWQGVKFVINVVCPPMKYEGKKDTIGNNKSTSIQRFDTGTAPD
jgi:hypothetical protein